MIITSTPSTTNLFNSRTKIHQIDRIPATKMSNRVVESSPTSGCSINQEVPHIAPPSRSDTSPTTKRKSHTLDLPVDIPATSLHHTSISSSSQPQLSPRKYLTPSGKSTTSSAAAQTESAGAGIGKEIPQSAPEEKGDNNDDEWEEADKWVAALKKRAEEKFGDEHRALDEYYKEHGYPPPTEDELAEDPSEYLTDESEDKCCGSLE